MSDTLRTVELPSGDSVTYDSDMPMGVLIDLTGAASGDLGKLTESLSQMVTGWSLTGDPTDPEAWRKLRRSQFQAVIQEVMKDLGSLGNA
jgi:hypothetical protein